MIHNAIGYTDEGIELWLATGLDKREAKLDEGEFLEVFSLPFAEALAMAATGASPTSRPSSGSTGPPLGAVAAEGGASCSMLHPRRLAGGDRIPLLL